MKPVHLFFLCGSIVGSVYAESLTLPLDQRPGWLEREGIVMVGSWEPLIFRVRRDGSPDYTPTPEQLAAYRKEQSPEMVDQLKAMGANFVMMHCHKGGGLQAEGKSMTDAVRFSKLCHDKGLHVGVYSDSATFMWDLLFKEVPQAQDWILLDPKDNPYPYGYMTFRHFWDRNHPDGQAYVKNVIRFAVEEIQADLVHLDNYMFGPQYVANSTKRFRQYLRDNFTAEQIKKMGFEDVETVKPPAKYSRAYPPADFLGRAWVEFSCQSLADSYHIFSKYARSLRSDILMECNPAGIRDRIVCPIDHSRLLQGGEAFWDEGHPSGYEKGNFHSRIRTYKVARLMNNIAFCYTITPLEMAESMAFNRDCLGCICWFEYGKIVAKPGKKRSGFAGTDSFHSIFQNSP